MTIRFHHENRQLAAHRPMGAIQMKAGAFGDRVTLNVVCGRPDDHLIETSLSEPELAKA